MDNEKMLEGTALTWKRFGKTDWYGYAGCVPFADGSAPLSAPFELDGEQALAIFDGHGVFVDRLDEEGTFLHAGVIDHYDPKASLLPAAIAASRIPAKATTADLAGLGFRSE